MNRRHLSALMAIAAVLAVVAACDSDPPAPSGGCTTTQACPFKQLCDTVNHVCIPEPTDGYAGFFSCPVYDDASHPYDPMDNSSISEVVGTATSTKPARYAFYLDVNCTAYTKAHPPHFDVNFDTIPLGPDAQGLRIQLPWPPPTEFDLERSTSDPEIGSGHVEDVNDNVQGLGTRLAFVTGGHIHFDAMPVPGTTLTGYLHAIAAGTPSMQQPLLTDCTTLGLAACGPTPGSACSDFQKPGAKGNACTFPCTMQSECDPYGGICDAAAGVCTKGCGTAADCPSFLSCGTMPSTGTQLVCN